MNPRIYIFCLLMPVLVSCAGTRNLSYRAKGNSASHFALSKARDLIGTRYKYAGADKRGFDCSGLVYYVYAEAGIQLPRSSYDQSTIGRKVKVRELEPGDLVFFGKGRIDHVGIVERATPKSLVMIHSSSSKGVVRQDVLASHYWSKRLRFGVKM